MIEKKDEDCHLLSVCVKEGYRGQGLGNQLQRYIVDVVCKEMKTLYAETRESNKYSRKMLEDCGFQWTKTIPCYYEKPDEAACVYQKKKM